MTLRVALSSRGNEADQTDKNPHRDDEHHHEADDPRQLPRRWVAALLEQRSLTIRQLIERRTPRPLAVTGWCGHGLAPSWDRIGEKPRPDSPPVDLGPS